MWMGCWSCEISGEVYGGTYFWWASHVFVFRSVTLSLFLFLLLCILNVCRKIKQKGKELDDIQKEIDDLAAWMKDSTKQAERDDEKVDQLSSLSLSTGQTNLYNITDSSQEFNTNTNIIQIGTSPPDSSSPHISSSLPTNLPSDKKSSATLSTRSDEQQSSRMNGMDECDDRTPLLQSKPSNTRSSE